MMTQFMGPMSDRAIFGNDNCELIIGFTESNCHDPLRWTDIRSSRSRMHDKHYIKFTNFLRRQTCTNLSIRNEISH